MREEGKRMLSTQIVQSQLIENFTNCIAWYIRLNLNMIFQIKVLEDQSFDKRLSQFG